MVGEVRDKETTELAIQAALTGHLVFSTLHTNTAAGALPRLLDLGAEPFLIASSINCVQAQRVVRKVCTNCKTEYAPPEAVIQDVKNVLGKLYTLDKPKLVKGNGCEACGGTGYSGRIGIFEVLPVTERVSRLVLERAALSAIEQEAEAEGMITMKQDGYAKALEGITTIEEVLRVAQD
jgi:type II secretory ATPase GspE/PulE/Tfp pilus assembly ATPase PilB-like protein